ncbi:hypothetical protein NLG97_g4302 [Lecanicillium saksenae]|uniref:Uncharacterized protein n=1 Tax=Lecanicillium saksenae TaxID=468837 RepID=A0ACC1QY95_9HYPO|nr:hypothetical protein NLG97_g4302 [Lecanicillium saksenae]
MLLARLPAQRANSYPPVRLGRRAAAAGYHLCLLLHQRREQERPKILVEKRWLLRVLQTLARENPPKTNRALRSHELFDAPLDSRKTTPRTRLMMMVTTNPNLHFSRISLLQIKIRPQILPPLCEETVAHRGDAATNTSHVSVFISLKHLIHPQALGLWTGEPSVRSPSGKGKLSSQEGSDGTPSMGSSFSDLDDASVTQSALEEALASHMHGAGSRFSISQAFRSSYFVNDEDEIRSIADSDYYFNYFLSRNPRVNQRQRFEFDAAVQKVIHERLESRGLRKIPLPTVASASDAKHVNIFVSDNIEKAERILIIFGECTKELGLVAGRIAGGPGGINKGSMVDAVTAIQRNESTGIILANMGESYWSPAYKRAMTVAAGAALPMPSLVHLGIKYHSQVNDIPGSESPIDHARTVFDTAVTKYANKYAKITIIAIGGSCEAIVSLLDEEKTWANCGSSLQAALFYSPAFYHEPKRVGLKTFLIKKSRGYVVSEQPLGTPLSGPDGNTAERIPPLGFPCYSSGEPSLDELCFIGALEHGLSYLDEVAKSKAYENPEVMIISRATPEEAEAAWERLSDGQRPALSTLNEEKLQKEVKVLRRWKYFEKTGHVPDSDEESDLEDHINDTNLPVKPWDEAS